MASAVCEPEVPTKGASKQAEQPEMWWETFIPDTEALTTMRDEYAAIASRSATRPAAGEQDADAEFTAILKMKTEPLVLTSGEAEVFAGVRQRRSRRVGKPLPLE
jgi:hypothetical protein